MAGRHGSSFQALSLVKNTYSASVSARMPLPPRGKNEKKNRAYAVWDKTEKKRGAEGEWRG